MIAGSLPDAGLGIVPTGPEFVGGPRTARRYRIFGRWHAVQRRSTPQHIVCRSVHTVVGTSPIGPTGHPSPLGSTSHFVAVAPSNENSLEARSAPSLVETCPPTSWETVSPALPPASSQNASAGSHLTSWAAAVRVEAEAKATVAPVLHLPRAVAVVFEPAPIRAQYMVPSPDPEKDESVALRQTAPGIQSSEVSSRFGVHLRWATVRRVSVTGPSLAHLRARAAGPSPFPPAALAGPLPGTDGHVPAGYPDTATSSHFRSASHHLDHRLSSAIAVA